MSKTEMISARIEPELKEKAQRVFKELGLTTTQAITLFYQQVELCNGMPFDVVVGNAATKKTLGDTDAGRCLIVCEDAEDMFDKLDI